MELIDGAARFCICRLAQIRATRLAKIPHRFAKHNLTSLVPRGQQTAILPILQQNPEGSYVFAGRTGTGKSLMMWLLYRHAIKQTDRRVVVCTLSELLDEYRAFIQSSVNRETPKIPSINAAELRQKERPYSLFLDDIDKARPTEYAAEQFFELINAIYDFQHQLVVTTNLSIEALRDHFNRADDRFGNAIVRRLTDGRRIVEMF